MVGVSDTSATVQWSTSSPGTSQVEYGATTAYGSNTNFDGSLSTSHAQLLTGLVASTTYHFRVHSKDASGTDVVSPDSTFSTTSPSSTSGQQPVISNVSVQNITHNSATIVWTTDISASGQVQYGTTTAYGTVSPLDSVLSTSHSITITGLQSGLTYHFSVLAGTSSGGSSVSPDFNFTTLAGSNTSLTIASTAVTGTQSDTVAVSWVTNVPATSQVEYGTTVSYGSASVPDNNLVTMHSVMLAGLTAGTQYHFRVKSGASANVFDVVSPDGTFNMTLPVLAVTNVGSTAVGTTTATITWITNTGATSQVEYGTSTAYGTQTVLDSTTVTAHSQTLSGLIPGTVYHYRVRSSNSSGTSVTSGDYTFTTVSAQSLTISNVAAVAIGATSASIVWSTSQPSTSQVQYGVSASYGSTSDLGTGLVTLHSRVLSGLSASSTYHYRVISTDMNGNSIQSDDFTFTTMASSGGGLPTGIGWHELANTTLQGHCATPDSPDSITLVEGCKAVIRDWSGGIADTVRNRLIMWGGGHSGYGGNELYALDLNAQPPVIEQLNAPTVPGVGQCSNLTQSSSCVEELPPANPYGVCSEGGGGYPNARHTYGGLTYDPDFDSMFAFGGSKACGPGNGTVQTWLLSLKTLTSINPDGSLPNPWQLMNKLPGQNLGLPGKGGTWAGDTADYDPNSKVVWLFDGNSLYSYDPGSNSYIKRTTTDTLLGDSYTYGVIDPFHKLFLIFGQSPFGTKPGIINAFDISSTSSYALQDFTPQANAACGSSTPGQLSGVFSVYGGLAYDPVWKVIVAWPNFGGTVYLYNADATVPVSTPFGTVPARGCLQVGENVLGTVRDSAHQGTAATTNGTFGRFRYFPGLDIFALCNDWNLNCSILRLR